MRHYHWSQEEQDRFEAGLIKFGRKQMKLVCQYIGTRTLTQVHSHAQKYFMKQALVEQQASERKDTDLEDKKPEVPNADPLLICQD